MARLLGIQNLSHGRVGEGGTVVAGGARLTAPVGGMRPGTPVLWCIRPEHLQVLAAEESDDDGAGLPAVALDVADVGTATLLTVRLDDGPELRVRCTDLVLVETGAPCRVVIDPARVTVWPAQPGEETSTTTLVDLTEATAVTPGSSPSSSAASRLINDTTR